GGRVSKCGGGGPPVCGSAEQPVNKKTMMLIWSRRRMLLLRSCPAVSKGRAAHPGTAFRRVTPGVAPRPLAPATSIAGRGTRQAACACKHLHYFRLLSAGHAACLTHRAKKTQAGSVHENERPLEPARFSLRGFGRPHRQRAAGALRLQDTPDHRVRPWADRARRSGSNRG